MGAKRNAHTINVAVDMEVYRAAKSAAEDAGMMFNRWIERAMRERLGTVAHVAGEHVRPPADMDNGSLPSGSNPGPRRPEPEYEELDDPVMGNQPVLEEKVKQGKTKPLSERLRGLREK